MAEVPLELPTGRVVGKFIFEVQDNSDPGEEPQLIPVTGDIIIKSSIDNLSIFDQSLGKFITFRGPHKAIVNSLGELATPDPITGDPMYTGMSLWSNDSEKLSVKGWTYTATFNLKTSDGKTLNLPPATFTLATGQEVDLADVIKVPATPGYGLPQAEGAALRAEAAAVESSQSSLTAIQMAQSVIDRADTGEFDGDQGVPGNATMRIDTTVGTRVFITDGVTERMVRGDTGWRNVTPANGWGGLLFIRRLGNVVDLRIEGISPETASSPVVYVFPAGFNPAGVNTIPRLRGVVSIGNGTTITTRRFYVQNSELTVDTPLAVGVAMHGQLSGLTTDPWPTALP